MTGLPEVELGKVAVFVRGITFTPKDVLPVGTPGTVACMRTKNVQTELDLADVWGIPESFVRRGDQYLLPGDTLVSSANSWNLVGKCCWVPRLPWTSTFGGFVSVLRPDPAKVEPRYLFRWFASDRTQATVRSLGQQTTNISNLNVDRCLKLKLRLPPLGEQGRLAEILDKADALRAKRRAALVQLDSLTQSIFLDMFGDPAINPRGFPRTRLDALVRAGDSINYGVVQPGDEFKDGVPLVRVGDLQNGKVEQSTLKRISPSIESAYKRSRLRGDEVLISCVGSTGMIALVDDSMKGFNIARAVARVPLAECVDRTYVASYLRTGYVQRYFKNELRTVSQPTLNIKQISETAVLVPPVDLQREFAHRIKAVTRLCVRQQESLLGLNEAFTSVQARAFRGDL